MKADSDTGTPTDVSFVGVLEDEVALEYERIREALSGVASNRRKLERLKRRSKKIDAEYQAHVAEVAHFAKYCEAVARKDRVFPAFLTCLGCRRR